ncbi:hypothetical protein K504DRAFT_371560, partial [Pleomassaria siparia CBS 279.74]
TQVLPSDGLNWVPCFASNVHGRDISFDCARLKVPLDYANPSVGRTTVAFIRYSSTVQPVKGDLLINPGGPGVSGVSLVLQGYASLQELLGDGYNLVGFDPRGINNSGLNLDCFSDISSPRHSRFEQYLPFDSNSLSSMAEHFQLTGAYGDFCSRKLSGDTRYANTVAVAQDMLRYVEKLAESRGEEPGQAMLNYYGISYGTVIGITFAALFPGRVGRFILDGVDDVDDWYFGPGVSALIQADDAVRSFFQSCFDARTKCPFYRNDASSADLGARFDALLDAIDRMPVIVSDPAVVDSPTVITSWEIRAAISQLIYSPISGFPRLAGLFAALESGDLSPIIKTEPTLLSPNRGTMPACGVPTATHSMADGRIVACNDMAGRYRLSNMSLWYDHVDKMSAGSKYIGSTVASYWAPLCRSLKVSPPPSQVFSGLNKTVTSNAILFLRNRIDPVTPSAERMSSFFPGSVVLTQDAVGHGIMASQSTCILGYLQEYLESNRLPPPNALCGVSVVPFGLVTGETG